MYLYIGAASELRVRFRASEIGLSLPVVFLLAVPRRFHYCSSSLCVGGFISGTCYIIICSSSLLLLVPLEGFASLLWHFLAINLRSDKVKISYIIRLDIRIKLYAYRQVIAKSKDYIIRLGRASVFVSSKITEEIFPFSLTYVKAPSREDATAIIIWAVPCENCLRAYAHSEGQDQPAHPRSLIKAFTVR